MDPETLRDASELAWLWWGLPLLGILGAILSALLMLPQATRLRAAFAAFVKHDRGADGEMTPSASILLSTAASYGAAAAVGAAMAVSLGGPGAIAWVWLFTFLMAPLRWAEAMLSRTSPPGKARAKGERGGGAPGSLARRLLADPRGGVRVLGSALLVLIPLVALAYFGGVQGEAVRAAAGSLAPDQALPIGIGVAVLAGVLAIVGARRVGSPLGWLAFATLLALAGVGVASGLAEPGRFFTAISRAVADMIQGAPKVSAWSGALAGEIVRASVSHLLLPLSATTGASGALHGLARAETSRDQAAGALLGPLLFGLLTTFLGLSFVATGAYHRRVEDSRSVTEMRVYRGQMGFETVSQRMETDRFFTGYLRILEGRAQAQGVEIGAERAMIESPRWEEANGDPADLAFVIRDGRAVGLRRSVDGILTEVSAEELRSIRVRGQVPPRGARLVEASASSAGGEIASRIVMVALLLLAMLGAAAWGMALTASLRGRVPEPAARAASLLPGLGLGLGAAGIVPWMGAVGGLLALLTFSLSAAGMLTQLRSLRALLPKVGGGGGASSAKAKTKAKGAGGGEDAEDAEDAEDTGEGAEAQPSEAPKRAKKRKRSKASTKSTKRSSKRSG